jgi:predicted transcriptional regulator of viral defense system
MDINSLHERNLIALPQKEQGLAWLVAHGPLVSDPPLPMPVLRGLVADRRVLRLRRGLYLAPTTEARLPALAKTINLADPDGYISGHGALMLLGLNDQDIAEWYSVTPRRQGDLEYGVFRVHFVYSPTRAATGARTSAVIRGDSIVLATPAQALFDEVDLMPFGLDYAETGRVLRNALEADRVTESEIVDLVRGRRSVAAARRLGFLAEVASGRENRDLLSIAQAHSGMTRLASDGVAEWKWRLYLPRTRDSIVRASR